MGTLETTHYKTFTEKRSKKQRWQGWSKKDPKGSYSTRDPVLVCFDIIFPQKFQVNNLSNLIIKLKSFKLTKCQSHDKSFLPGFFSEAATRGVLKINVLLKISQNSEENTCARVSFLIKLRASGLQLY